MFIFFCLTVILHITTIKMYSHHKPLAERIWSERCVRNSIVLNDCNWCRCNPNQKYDCKARVCEEIDMFGHFKDAIQEIDVGMEGHGSWRSKPSACTPGVHYRRGAVLCVCDGDGNWPNPVCRDLFQILHSVELTGQTRLTHNEKCDPTKLYLVGCNVCLCPSTGNLNPKMCTKRECQEDDPVLETNQTPLINIPPSNNDVEQVLEIYGTCDPNHKYKLGCRNCDCLLNNRLLCDTCSLITIDEQLSLNEPLKPERRNKHLKRNRLSIPAKLAKPTHSNSKCRNKTPLKVFRYGCNLCHCGRTSTMFCTIRKCLKKTKKLKSSFQIANKELNNPMFELVPEPPDEESCTPGTKFKNECNICWCREMGNGFKHIICTRKRCLPKGQKVINKLEYPKILDIQNEDCAVGHFYEEHCKICRCYMSNDVKHEECRLEERCVSDSFRPDSKVTLQWDLLDDINTLRGFCQPMRRYKNDCNTCRCLSDGKTVECTSKVCLLRSGDISVDIVPVVIENGEKCPKGHSYELDCNSCFCLSNGNAICTTEDCSKYNKFMY